MADPVPMVFDLPTGWLDTTGALQRRIEIREMTGYEEDLIGDDRYPYNVRMNKILAGCTAKIGSASDKKQLEQIMDELTSVDRIKILVMIRCVSVEEGSILTFDAVCPGCSKKEPHQVDLLMLQFEGPKDPKLREYDVDLPSGKKAKCKILTGAAENRLAELAQADVMSGAILLRLTSLDGKPNPALADVKSMVLKDRTFLRKRFDELEGGFERNIQVGCGKCKMEFETKIDLGMMELFYRDLRKKE